MVRCSLQGNSFEYPNLFPNGHGSVLHVQGHSDKSHAQTCYRSKPCARGHGGHSSHGPGDRHDRQHGVVEQLLMKRSRSDRLQDGHDQDLLASMCLIVCVCVRLRASDCHDAMRSCLARVIVMPGVIVSARARACSICLCLCLCCFVLTTLPVHASFFMCAMASCLVCLIVCSFLCLFADVCVCVSASVRVFACICGLIVLRLLRLPSLPCTCVL